MKKERARATLTKTKSSTAGAMFMNEKAPEAKLCHFTTAPQPWYMRHEDNGCEKSQWPFLKNNKGSTQRFRNYLTEPDN